MPSTLTLKLIGGIAVALALAFLIHLEKYWHGQAVAARAQVAEICSAVRIASGNSKLDCKDTAAQVGLLGQAVTSLKASVASQNAAVDALAAATADQQKKAAEAAQDARQRAKEASDVSDSLKASARSNERQAKPCEPSEKLKEAWK